MSGFLLDTNIISELVKPKPEANVTEWVENTDESLLYLSVLELGEIRRGIAALPQSRRQATFEAWLDKDLRARFEGRILVIDQEVADRWGLLTATAAVIAESYCPSMEVSWRLLRWNTISHSLQEIPDRFHRWA